ncbi:MAG: VWA domain-containing protein [Planctomycetes bacterium]|nr:VWA domain-containing protein [Planctomycetota bacterium]
MTQRRSTRFLAGCWLLLLCCAGPRVGVAGGPADDRLQRNFEVVFDTSGSMNDRSKIQQAKESLKEFLRHLPDDANLGLIVFRGGAPQRVLPVGPLRRAETERLVGTLTANGATPICDSIRLAAASLRKRREAQGGYGTYTIVVVTDGEETVNARGLPGSVQSTLAEGVAIDVIGFDLDSSHSLKTMVTSYREARNQEELTRAVLDTLAEVGTYEEAAAFVRMEEAAPRRPVETAAPLPEAANTSGGGWTPTQAPTVQPGKTVGSACCYMLAMVFGGLFVAARLTRRSRRR